MLEETWTHLHTHDTLSYHIQKTKYIKISVPTRIRERWRSAAGFYISKALSEAQVSAEKFKTCWKRVRATIPKEELFRLFEKTFGSEDNLHRKVDFINDILRRYQGMTEPVRDCVACLPFVSMCCVGLLLYQCSISCVLIALTDYTTPYPTIFRRQNPNPSHGRV